MTRGFSSLSALDLLSPRSVLLSGLENPRHNMGNKPDDMKNKSDLVHFKTRVGYFALVWETRLPNLFVIIPIWA